MTNREILGELKQCWEYITDIKDNQYEQLTQEEVGMLSEIRNNLIDTYNGLYNRLYNNNIQTKDELRVKKLDDIDNHLRYYISSDISGDYEIHNLKTGEIDYVSCEDCDYYYWYKDDDFLNYYNEESDN